MRLLDKIEDDVTAVLERFGIPSYVVLGDAESVQLHQELQDQHTTSTDTRALLVGYSFFFAGVVKFVFTRMPTAYEIVCEVPPKTDAELIEMELAMASNAGD